MKRVMKILRNLFGVFICTLFLVLASPVKADLLFKNLETLTSDEDWDPGDCTSASGYCIIGATEHWGVALPAN